MLTRGDCGEYGYYRSSTRGAGRKCGRETSIEKAQVMKESSRNKSLWIKAGSKELKKVDNFENFGSLLARYSYCTTKMKNKKITIHQKIITVDK